MPKKIHIFHHSAGKKFIDTKPYRNNFVSGLNIRITHVTRIHSKTQSHGAKPLGELTNFDYSLNSSFEISNISNEIGSKNLFLKATNELETGFGAKGAKPPHSQNIFFNKNGMSPLGQAFKNWVPNGGSTPSSPNDVCDDEFQTIPVEYSSTVFITSKVPNIQSRNILRFIFTIVYGDEQNTVELKRPGEGTPPVNLLPKEISKSTQNLNQTFQNNSVGKGVRPVNKKVHKLSWVGSFASRTPRQKFLYQSLGTFVPGRAGPSQLTIFGILPIFLLFGTVQTANYVQTLQTNPNTTTLGVSSSCTPKVNARETSRTENLSRETGNLSPGAGVALLSSNFYLQKALQENLLRIPDYVSKIYIVWGLLYIWKGVRPQRKMFKEGGNASSQTRIIWPNQPSGGLRRLLGSRINLGRKNKLGSQVNGFSSDKLSTSLEITHQLKGLTAFLPILETLVQSLKSERRMLVPDPVTLLHDNVFYLFQQKNNRLGSFGRESESSPRLPVKNKRKSYAPKGYLFVGPPGTGKTLLAQALAREANVPLLCVSASEIQKQIEIGTRIGALRLRKLFEQARRLAPCILFLDEIDAIGRSRGNVEQNSQDGQRGEARSGGNLSSADLKLFTEFLVQMDSFPGPGNAGGFIVIGTTNFLSSLDSAFIRSGRFDRILGLNYPSKQVRIEILQWYSGLSHSTTFQKETDSIPWNYFGYFTEGFSPADLSRVVNESVLAQCKTQNNHSQKGVHTFETLQKGLNRIHLHKKYLF